jgi:hypothetical protein
LLLLAIKLALKVLQMKLSNFDEIDNLTKVQLLMVKACLSGFKEEREKLVREWEELVVIDEIDFSSSRLIPFFFNGNQQLGIETRHDKRMKIVYKHWWLRTQHISHQLKIVHAAFFEAGIPCVVIKGASIKVHYERDELRPMADFDLLIPRKQLRQALSILQSLFYDPNMHQYNIITSHIEGIYLDFFHAITCIQSKVDCRLDLHWRIGSRCSAKLSDSLWLNLEKYDPIPNAQKPKLAFEVFMIIIHAVDSRSKDNLNWIIDIAVINQKTDHSFWNEARKIAVSERKEDLFDYGCAVLIELGISAPNPETISIPNNLMPVNPDDKPKGFIRKISYVVRNRYKTIERLYPYSNDFYKFYKISQYIYVLFLVKISTLIKNKS